jgi:hypothetical protein
LKLPPLAVLAAAGYRRADENINVTVFDVDGRNRVGSPGMNRIKRMLTETENLIGPKASPAMTGTSTLKEADPLVRWGCDAVGDRGG